MFDEIVRILTQEFGDDAEEVAGDYYDLDDFETAKDAAAWILAHERYMSPTPMDPDEQEFEEWILTERGEPRTNGDIADALRDFVRTRRQR